MQSIEWQIEILILCKQKGTLFFPEDFQHTGSSEAIRKALQRLENKGSIRRVAHGIMDQTNYERSNQCIDSTIYPLLLKPKLSSNQFLIIKEPIKFAKSVISPLALAFSRAFIYSGLLST